MDSTTWQVHSLPYFPCYFTNAFPPENKWLKTQDKCFRTDCTLWCCWPTLFEDRLGSSFFIAIDCVMFWGELTLGVLKLLGPETAGKMGSGGSVGLSRSVRFPPFATSIFRSALRLGGCFRPVIKYATIFHQIDWTFQELVSVMVFCLALSLSLTLFSRF